MTEQLFSFFPPQFWMLVPITVLGTFFATQAVKYVFNVNASLPGLGPMLLRLIAVVIAYPVSLMTLELFNDAISSWTVPLPLALLSWGLAHFLAHHGMHLFYAVKPEWAARFDGKQPT